MAGATVGVTISSSSDVDRKTLEEASCDVVNESSDKGNSWGSFCNKQKSEINFKEFLIMPPMQSHSAKAPFLPVEEEERNSNQ